MHIDIYKKMPRLIHDSMPSDISVDADQLFNFKNQRKIKK